MTTYTLKVNVQNGTTNPNLVVDVDFARGGILVAGNRALFIRADLDAAGISSDVAETIVEDTPAKVLAHALTIHDARVCFDAEKHPRLVAALAGDLEALDRKVWEQRERDAQNAFLREKGYRWKKESFYAGGEIDDVVTRWFLFNPAGEKVVGFKPAMWGIEAFGNLERILTELGFHGDAEKQDLADGDARRAELRAAHDIVDNADLGLYADAGTFEVPPTGTKRFGIDNSRTAYAVVEGEAIYVCFYNNADGDNWSMNNDGAYISRRFPYCEKVAAALALLSSAR